MRLPDILGKEREIFSERYDGHTITITEKGKVRTLKCNEVIFSRIDRGSLYTHEYWDFFIPLAYLYQEPRILMIGLGGGTMAYQFSKMLGEKLSLDIVENDRRMAEIYPKFLGNEVNCNIIVDEGADYVSREKLKYDILILDAYKPDGRIPEHFLQSKFIRDAYESLKEEGIFSVNCIGSMLGPELDSFVQNISEKFEVYRLDTSYFTVNIVLVCTKNLGKEELLKRLHDNMRVNRENEFLIRAYDSSKRVFITV